MICAGPATSASRTLALQPRGWPTFASAAAISLACSSFSAISVTKWIDPTVEVVQLYLFISSPLPYPVRAALPVRQIERVDRPTHVFERQLAVIRRADADAGAF